MTTLIFFGSDQYSAVALATILESQNGLKIEVITDRPKPVGKGLVLTPSPVEILAKTHNLNISYYPDLDHSLITKDTLGLCASFDHLIPANIIELFAGNLYNLHPSLLPQYRNVSPVQYAIAMGDTVTGITLFRISTGIDNGEIISQVSEPILPTDTLATLTPRLFKLGADLLLQFIQTNSKSTIHDLQSTNLIFTHRLTRDSGFIEWPVLHKLLDGKPVAPNESGNELLNLRLTHNSIDPRSTIYDLLRALTPWPTVWTTIPTKKGELRVMLESVIPDTKLKIAGKPNAISYDDFEKYYLQK